jgi:hypothetical protein
MYSKQMLCIVTPPYPGNPVFLAAPNAQLDTLFHDVGCVHFSSLVLLPPPLPGGGDPSLMLELTVDDNIEPANLMQMLTAQGFVPLWNLFGVFMPNQNNSTQNQRSEWLTAFLLEHTDMAAGGFVGPRDRSVAQILRESLLFQAARRELRRIVDPSPGRHERAELALHMQQWLRGTPAFRWATSPAPRSFWRSKWANKYTRSAAVTLILTIGGILWAPFAFGLAALVPALIIVFVLTFVAAMVLIFSVPALAAASALVPVGVVTLVLVIISVFLVRPFLGIPWVLVLFACLLFYDLWAGAWVWELKVGELVLILAASVLMALATVALLAVLIVLIVGIQRMILWWLARLGETDLKRGQQIPAAVDRCEGEIALTREINHMVSLTDVRRPYCVMGPILRFWLWAVGNIGQILYTNGMLAEAPGILFAHWHVIENGKRLLFCSNFDSPFGGYLDDFITGTPKGINLIWRWSHLLERKAARPGDPEVLHARNYPPTLFWFARGCAYELWFKSYARDSMLPHLYRYAAYRNTYVSIDRATRLRDALTGPRTPVKDDQIMRALES